MAYETAKPRTTKLPADPSAPAKANWDAYIRARDAGHLDYIEVAKKCDRFYRGGGEQWDAADKAKLDAQGRPTLETNMIFSTVNAILGEHATQRGDIVFKPRANALSDTAHAITKLAGYIQDDNKYEWREAQVFADGVIQDRGYFDVRMDFTDNMMGKIVISVEDPVDILLSPDAKEYDPATWPEVIKSRWMSIDDIAAQYGPEAAEKAKKCGTDSGAGYYGQDSVRFETNRFGEPDHFATVADTEDRKVRNIRVIERQFRKLGMARFWVDAITGEMKMISESIPNERAAQLAQAYGLHIIKKMASRIRWTVSVDREVLHDDWSPYKDFTLVPYFPYFRRGKPVGAVRNLLKPQEHLNKIESQTLHIVNTTANSGWAVEAGSLVNMTEQDLEQRGAETGLVLVYRSGRQAPEKIQPNQIPTGLDRIAAITRESVRVISGVSDALLGSAGPEVSGVALDRKMSRGMVQLQVPFTHLAFTRHLLAERMLHLIQQYYTEERTFVTVDYRSLNQESQEMVINKATPDGTLNDVTVGEFGITISSAPARDTFQDTQFAEALQMRSEGVAIPDWFVVESSNLDRKMEIADFMRQQAGLGEPTEQQQMLEQLSMEMAMAQLEELRAKVAKLQGEAQLAAAKAAASGDASQLQQLQMQTDVQLEMEKLRASMMQLSMNLQNKLQLAGIHAKAKEDLTKYTTTAKRTVDELKMRTDLTKTGMSLSAPRSKK